MKIEALSSPFRVEPVTISFDESSAFTEVYGFVGKSGRVFLEGQRFVPEGAPSDTLLLFMHPSSSLSLLPLPRALAAAGRHVMCCGSRYLRNDSALIMEKVALDLGAYVRYAREGLGYRKVVLVGWSGGGSLALFYQAQAERPTVRSTPAGDEVDLTRAELPPADALLSVAAHLSRAETLSEWIDPAVLDERDPERIDPELDLYGALVKPPYSTAFLARFREAQRARVARIDAACREELARLAQRGGELERAFVVHRTMADPRWLDPAVDPNERKPGHCYLGIPRVVNSGPVGLARFTTLRSFLSQWSLSSSQATATRAAPGVSVPALVLENGADDATPASHPRLIHRLLGARDKTFARIPGATHYYQGQPELLQEAVQLCTDWLDARSL
jgi:dienelactone hydrolase